VLVADETMSELWLDPDVEMPRPVCAFDPAGSTVITVGSASKAFWAGLRIGWVRAAPEVIRSLVAARAYADLGTPVLEQLAVNWLFGTDGWERAVEIRRAQAREPQHGDSRAAASSAGRALKRPRSSLIRPESRRAAAAPRRHPDEY
jgi:DNA-binding transcriptional MocR family regulator